ncbi:MAG: FAD:protein FMN transferase [Deltaproteobacteria bacterium]|nr:FAD:protein FMN transferase [Deltaproteobacteria bacterium]
MTKHRLVASFLGILLALPAWAAETVTSRQEKHMGTYVTITVAAPESPEVLASIAAGFAEVNRLEDLLSEWRADSQISKVNRAAGQEAVVVDPELFKVAKMAHEVSAKTHGAFDVTFAALSGLWDFKAKKPVLPEDENIAKAIKLVNWRGLGLDAKSHSLHLAQPGMRCGLGAIAKGYVVDRVSAILKARGQANHLVIAGGDLYAAGRKGGKPWRIGIQHPAGRGLYAAMDVVNQGVATSGNYEKFFILEGKRYHHILDPRTGRPARGASSATVLAKTAAEADAYATGLFVLGPEEGKKLAESIPGLDVLFFREDYSTTATDGITSRLQPVIRGEAE